MKTIVDYLQQKNLLFKSLKQITAKSLESRKKIDIYVGVDLKNYYVLILHLEKKSRVISKEVEVLMQLHEKVEQFMDTKIKKRYIIIKAPLCSKAKKLLEDNGYKVYHDFS